MIIFLLQERMIQESFYSVLLSYSSISSTKISNRVLAIVIIDQVCYMGTVIIVVSGFLAL